jgi:SAM-dependent methyltransferase
MFTETTALYDIIYSTFKDYDAESAKIAALLERERPGCRTVLDVACGTGEHARLLAERQGLAVDGIDLEPAFVEIAQRKNPTGRFVVSDMRDFHLPGRYDAVICLFSSIGYLRTMDRVREALACFREHLAPGGVVVVEPWFGPGILQDGYVGTNVGERDGVHVERTSRTEVDGLLSRLHFDYDITDASGTRHASEVHELGLFTPDEMRAAFEANGLTAAYDPVGLIGRGLPGRSPPCIAFRLAFQLARSRARRCSRCSRRQPSRRTPSRLPRATSPSRRRRRPAPRMRSSSSSS